MSSVAKKSRRKKEAKKEVKKEKEPPQVVTCNLADNEYTGIIREGALGSTYLDGSAKYTWKTRIRYEGPFANSLIAGRGRYTWPDGSTYDGQLCQGKRHGDGSYVAPDGITRYEGQFLMGKRHGRGRLSYSPDGGSYFEGDWLDGKKHGTGKQLWPSGNMYQGQWEQGKMSGHGKMTWYTNGIVEEYSGMWVDNKPHGEGEHVWKEPEPKTEIGARDGAGPQQNNRYEGQWNQGERHGTGSFYYANGAKYRGEWDDHKKHGKGIHTSEDGRTSTGPFANDQMLNGSPVTVDDEKKSDDNPIRRQIDISDIEVFALPDDTRGLACHPNAYSDRRQILREVHNMLLRNLSELKELYWKYRTLQPHPSADPFTLTASQLWLFARDVGLVTPGCSLVQLNRAIFSGSRHHHGVAPDDAEYTRPLTPGRRRVSVASSAAAAAAAAGSRPHSQQAGHGEATDIVYEGQSRPVSQGAATASQFDDSEEEDENMSDVSPTHDAGSKSLNAHGAESEGPAPRPTSSTSLGGALARSTSKDRPFSREAHGTAYVQPCGQFARPAGSRGLANIHSPTSPLLFRSFLESLVRVALVRFPNERGMEPQVNRMFKDTIQPHFEDKYKSEDTFAFLVDKEFRSVLEEFTPVLWRLFKNEQPPAIRAPAQSFFAARRELHIGARHDTTGRVKDVLRLLESTGFLRPVPSKQIIQDDRFCELFYDNLDDEEQSAEGDQNIEGRNHVKMSLGLAGGLSGPPPPSVIVQQEGSRTGSRGTGGSAAGRTRTRDQDMEKALIEEEKDGSPRKGITVVVQVATQADMLRCDFAVTALEALSIFTEVSSPGTIEALRWELDPDQSHLWDEAVSALEYTETELVFSEFIRVLVRMADQGTQMDPGLCERVSLAKRFDSFIRHVFLPALKEKYVSPEPIPEEEPGTPEDGGEEDYLLSAPPSAEAAVEDAAGSSATDGVEGEVVEAEAGDEEPPDADLWPGFEGFASDGAAAELAQAPRFWPKGYEQEVARW